MAVQLFLSCVSDEFGAYRDALRRALTRPNVEVKIQEDFKALGGDTLAKLEEYIGQCQAVVHFAGDLTGSAPNDYVVREMLARRPDLKAGCRRSAPRSMRASRFLHAMGGLARDLFSTSFGDCRASARRRPRCEIAGDQNPNPCKPSI